MEASRPLFLDRGLIVDAVYTATGIPDFDCNPLVQCLGPILSEEAAAEELSYYSDFDESMRDAANRVRKVYLQTRLRFFTPFDVHLDLEHRVSSALRVGYMERNPLNRGHWGKVETAITNFVEGRANGNNQRYAGTGGYSSTASVGFNIAGLGGTGKTQALSEVLKLFPQVINHKRYGELNLTERQLVWLKIDCPYDGSTTGLCLNIFQAIDSILDTSYKKYFGKGRPDELIASLAYAAANHHLGLLVIDEIQRLSLSKSGGVAKMLNFFVQLVNTIGVPVILVGTDKALPIFRGDFSQMRRGSGQGDTIWRRMDFDGDWMQFCDSMWQFEVTRNPTPDDKREHLFKVLYDESQGIIDLAIKIFLFAQELAIDISAEVTRNGTNADERLTPAIIRTAARDRFQILRPALEKFRKGHDGANEIYETLHSQYSRDNERRESRAEVIVLPTLDPSSGSGRSRKRTLREQSHDGDGAPAPPVTNRRATGRNKTQGKLPDILKEVQSAGGDAYRALTEADVIASKADFNFLSVNK